MRACANTHTQRGTHTRSTPRKRCRENKTERRRKREEEFKVGRVKKWKEKVKVHKKEKGKRERSAE